MNNIDFNVVLFVGAVGALVSLLVQLAFKIAKTFNPQVDQSRRGVITLIFMASICGTFANPYVAHKMMGLFSPRYRAISILETQTQAAARDPMFLKRIKGMNGQEIRNFTNQAAHLGIKRLSADQLTEWNRLRLLLAESSDTLCARLWTGDLGERDFLDGFIKLAPVDQKKWLEISVEATRAELNQKTFAPPGVDDLKVTLNMIAAKLPIGEGETFSAKVSKGTALNDADACWVMLRVLKGIPLLEKSVQERALRKLAMI